MVQVFLDFGSKLPASLAMQLSVNLEGQAMVVIFPFTKSDVCSIFGKLMFWELVPINQMISVQVSDYFSIITFGHLHGHTYTHTDTHTHIHVHILYRMFTQIPHVCLLFVYTLLSMSHEMIKRFSSRNLCGKHFDYNMLWTLPQGGLEHQVKMLARKRTFHH